MANEQSEYEEQLLELGNGLLHPPSTVDELLHLLDQAENILSRVEQSPSKSMQAALGPSMKALVADELLRHPDEDIKVAVASCMSEITRITAPDAPYDDERMKDVFQLIVSSFQNLSDNTSRSYNKRTLILETVAKVRSCVVMLDLECDSLIVEMFQHFLKSIRDYHPENVLLSMETIMSLVLEESEDISFELITPLLASVKRDNQEYLPIAQKLGERVFEKCALKLKPYLIQAKNSLGFSLDDYSKVIASIIDGRTGSAGNNDGNACAEEWTEESKPTGASLEGAAQADENKLAMASSTEATEDGATRENVKESLDEADHPATNRSLKALMSNGVTESGNEGTSADLESTKKPEHSHQTDLPVDTNVMGNAEPDDSDSGNRVNLGPKSEQASKKRGRKPKSSINSVEPHDSSQFDSNKEAKRLEDTADDDKSHKAEVHGSPPKGSCVDLSVDTNVIGNAEPDDSAERIKLGSRSEQAPKKRGRKPKSLITSAEPPDSSQADSNKEAKRLTEARDHNKSCTTEVQSSPSKEACVNISVPAETEKENVQISSPKALDSEPIVSPSQSGDVPDEGTKRKSGRQKRKSNLIQEVAPTTHVSKKASEGTSDSEVKPKKHSGKKVPAESVNEEITPDVEDISKTEGGITSLEAKPLEQSCPMVDVRDNVGDRSSSKKEGGKRRGRGKTASEDDGTKFTVKDDNKERGSSPKTSSKSAKIESHLEETPNTSSKRKRTPGKVEAPDIVEYDHNLVGKKIKVWWPKDKAFYDGVIDSFDSAKKRHKVLYTDGDEEILNLKREKWQFVRDDSASDGEEATERRSPDSSAEIHKRKKAKVNPELSAKQGNIEGSRGEASSGKLKGAATRSGRKLRDDDEVKSEDEHDGKTEYRSKRTAGKSAGDASKTAAKSKDTDDCSPNTSTKAKVDASKTGTKDTPRTGPNSKGKASSKTGNKSDADGSGTAKSGSAKVKETEGKGTVKTPESAKTGKGKSPGTSRRQETTDGKSGKKRRRGGY
ncbi:sister chromatid cohesion protein PDS5 homolog C-like [Diospyros lotus]|uniref:sister chromatid cohesion protein PDS5 homolog C-like n=1 Tax=Diospyros lotus TaxID=55363 RepID=UPI0022539B66|nr:sister chromatid cohesion protein PDS5 homolog C-like [Diospyros lotus]